jgi:hypothetical protein
MERTMSAPAKTSTLPEVPAEVLSFAAEKRVSEWVHPMLEMTARAFPDRSIKLYVQYDCEDPDWQVIVLETNLGDYTTEQYLAADNALGAEIVRSMPPHARQYFVNLCR